MFKTLKRMYSEYLYKKEIGSVAFRNVPSFIVGDRVEDREGYEGKVTAVQGETVTVSPYNTALLGDSRTYNQDDLYCQSVGSTAEITYDLSDKDWTPSHAIKTCNHWMQEFKLKEGSIYLSAYKGGAKKNDTGKQPTLGCYLDVNWQSQRFLMSPDVTVDDDLFDAKEHKAMHINWPDRGAIPVYDFSVAIMWCLRRIKEGEILEMGCYGAHGRTGTLLAGLLVREGATAKEAIDTVRTTYCKNAIESKKQEELIAQYEDALKETL